MFLYQRCKSGFLSDRDMEGNLDLTKLSRTVSYALRHEPWLYGLELDSYGWVHLIDLVVSLRCRRDEWRKLAENDIIEHRLLASGRFI